MNLQGVAANVKMKCGGQCNGNDNENN